MRNEKINEQKINLLKWGGWSLIDGDFLFKAVKAKANFCHSQKVNTAKLWLPHFSPPHQTFKTFESDDNSLGIISDGGSDSWWFSTQSHICKLSKSKTFPDSGEVHVRSFSQLSVLSMAYLGHKSITKSHIFFLPCVLKCKSSKTLTCQTIQKLDPDHRK